MIDKSSDEVLKNKQIMPNSVDVIHSTIIDMATKVAKYTYRCIGYLEERVKIDEMFSDTAAGDIVIIYTPCINYQDMNSTLSVRINPEIKLITLALGHTDEFEMKHIYQDDNMLEQFIVKFVRRLREINNSF